ncbi:hypothetical protein EDB81DRAFT_653997 [Dactylonectria macrodidyma]|uniref:Uncharacterized protein n=1 Tax=Dactylonectria macrodidyma TaxID=307937 RepID=A0A9P9ESB1_9HYPO|nr:hypothetical protein EDB81DRAFT_653997 [Dactylonectria macrodidyma]
MYQKSDEWLGAVGRSRLLGAKNFQYICGPICGILSSTLFLVSLAVAGLLPPVRANQTAEDVQQFWIARESRARWGAAIMMISATFYLPYTASVSAQLRRIPNLPYLATSMQLASGAAGIFTFITPAQVLALIAFRLERSAESTQTLTDLFFFFLMMPWPTFIVQDWIWAYAMLIDEQKKPIFPRFMAIFNIIVSGLYLCTLGMHATKSGAVAYHGGLSFWYVGIAFVLQIILDSVCLFFAIRTDPMDPTVHCTSQRKDSGGTLDGNSV